jgi:hypothetical protein
MGSQKTLLLALLIAVICGPAGLAATSTAHTAALAGPYGQLFALQVALNACDLNSDGAVNLLDVQSAVNMTLGTLPCTATILGPGACSVLMIQRVVNAAMTGACVTGLPHTVLLTWVMSTSPNVVGYGVYRAPNAGGPYTRVTSALVTATSYIDSTVQSGQTYYYVVTATDSAANESDFSNEASAVIPTP